MKFCTKCNKLKQLTEFARKGAEYRKAPCKECVNEAGRARYVKKARKRKSYEEKFLVRRTYRLKKHYKMTLQRFHEMIFLQGGRCAVCSLLTEALCVDHDHRCCPGETSCGKCIRGLLCNNCNRAIGLFKDHVPTLIAAVSYLSRAPVALPPQGPPVAPPNPAA